MGVVRTEAPLRVEVLGPIRVLDAADRDVTPSGALQRRLLALLVLRRGRVVPVDTAAEALWPADRPADPVAALQHHVSRLRRAVPGVTIDAVDNGYRLDPASVDVDLDRLTRALANGGRRRRRRDPARAVARPGVPRARRRRRGASRGSQPRRAAGAGARGRRRAPARAWRHRRTRRRADGAGRRAAAAGTTAPAADGRAGGDRDGGPRRCGSTTTSAGRWRPSSASSRRPALAAAARRAARRGRRRRPTVSASTPLPIPATSLIGRDELVAELLSAVGAGRLVTLVGPGWRRQDPPAARDRPPPARAPTRPPVVLCELAPADVDTTVDVVAAALGVDARPGTPLIGRITDVVGASDLVLLLDNCEHVLDPAAALAEHLLAACPNVRVVATSRERLRLAGEHVHVVPPLSFDGRRARSGDPAVPRSGARGRARLRARRRRAGADRRDRASPRRPAAGDRAGRGPPAHARRRRGGRRARPPLRAPVGRATARRRGTVRWARPWRGRTSCSTTSCGGPSSTSPCSPGRSTRAAAAAVAGTDPAAMATALDPARRALAADAHAQPPLRHARDAARVRCRAAGRGGAARCRHRAPRPPLRRVGRGRAAADARVRMSRCWPRSTPPSPSCATPSGGCSTTARSSRPAGSSARSVDYGVLRLRPDVLAWAERVVAADPDERSPLAAEVLGRRRPRGVDRRRRGDDGCPQRAGVGGRRR